MWWNRGRVTRSNLLKDTIPFGRRYSKFYYHRSITTYTHSQHASAISVLPTNIDTSSQAYQENKRQMNDILSGMRDLYAKIEEGGPLKARTKHVDRGKIMPRE